MRRVGAWHVLVVLAATACTEVADSTPATVAVPEAQSASTTSSTTSSTTVTTVPPTSEPGTNEPGTSEPVTATDPPERRVQTFVVPVADEGASWSDTHSAYPATDIFVPGGCGGTVVSPTDGVVIEVRTVDAWDPATDDPAARGGRSVAVLGLDGVRYYLAHFAEIGDDVVVGADVAAGDRLGVVGDSGRAGACHVHFSLSPPCPEPEWAVRRGVVWPYPYLDAWRSGEQRSPADEVARWTEQHPTACTDAAAGIVPDV